MTTRPILKAALIVTLGVVAIRVPSVAGAKKESVCTKPPELIPSPKPSKEEQKKAPKLKAQGMVAISISEEGDVVDATVVQSSTPEVADSLLVRAKSLKFKPRPGCGIFKTTVNYTLAGQ